MTSTPYTQIVQTVLAEKSPYIANLEFISDKESADEIFAIAKETKSNPGLIQGLNEGFTLDSCRNAQIRTPGYQPLFVRKHYTFFAPPGDSKTSPTEKLAKSYELSRARTLKYSLENNLISEQEHKQYFGYFDNTDKKVETSSTVSSADTSILSVDVSDDQNAMNNDQYLANIIEEIDQELKQMSLDTKQVDIVNEKRILINYKKSTHAVRPRRMHEDVSKRGGVGISYNTEYSTFVKSMNKEDPVAFEMVWCTTGDPEISPKDFTGKRYCVDKVPNNQFINILCGTPKDLLDFLSS